MTTDIFQEITDQVVAALKKGVRPWVRPWSTPGMPLRHVGVPYRGINSLKLWMEADDNGYWSPYWMTERQAMKYGAYVRDGEESTSVARPLIGTRSVDPVTGETAGFLVPTMQSYEVFNAEQFEGLPERFLPVAPPGLPSHPKDRIPEADDFLLHGVGATIRHSGAEAFYQRAADHVIMPRFERFRDAPSYYATLAHELVHWTGHPGRMKREFGKRFGDDKYAMEELVAELGSAFAMAILGVAGNAREDHASYLASWLRVLQNDNQAIFAAASHAQRATDYLTVSATSEQLSELATRLLNDRTYIVMYLDHVKIGSHSLLVAVGLDGDGHKRLLGVRSSAEDEHTQSGVARAMLGEMIDRGLPANHRRLFVTGGSGALRRAVSSVFGPGFLLQRCRSRLLRVVLSPLPWKVADQPPGTATLSRDDVRDKIHQAFEQGKAGEQALRCIASRLEQQGYLASAKVLQESLGDLFTVDWLDLQPSLRRSLSTTHVITQANTGLPRQICGIAHWREEEMALRWAVASFLETEKRFRKIAGYRHLQRLEDQLAQIGSP